MITKLSEIISILESGSRPKGGVKEGREGIPSLGGEHLSKEGGFNFSKLKMISHDFFSKMKRGKIEIGDILIVKDGATTGKVAIVREDFPFKEAAINEHLFRIRVDSDKAVQEYIFRYLQSPLGQLQILSSFRGAAIGGINTSFVDRVSLDLPSIDEQKRIADILDKANEIKKSSLQIQGARMRIIQSAFVEMFGDPIINPNKYPKILFGKLGTLDRGKSKHRPRNDSRLLGGEHPLIQTGEIRLASLFVNTFSSTYSDFGLAQSRKWPIGTLAITIAANIAESAILGIDACFPDSIVGFTPNSKSNSIFIKAQLDFLKDRISEVAPQSAQKNINLKILREIPMICPPVEMQEQFEDFVRNTTQIFDFVNKGIDLAEELTQSSVQSLIN